LVREIIESDTLGPLMSTERAVLDPTSTTGERQRRGGGLPAGRSHAFIGQAPEETDKALGGGGPIVSRCSLGLCGSWDG
jgi:hypothetical protein